MKTRSLIIFQLTLLAAAVVFGVILKGNLIGGPRLFHQMSGSLGGILSIITVVAIFRQAAPQNQKSLAVLAATFSLAAGAAGRSLESSANYQLVFGIMALTGLAATAMTFALFVLRQKHGDTTPSSQPTTSPAKQS